MPRGGLRVYLVGGAVPTGRWGGQLLVTHRQPGGRYTRYSASFPSDSVVFDTTRADLTRAVLEGVAFGLRDSFELIKASSGAGISQVRVSGGGAKSPLQMPAGNAHFASQRLNSEISVPVVKLRIRPIQPTIRLTVLLQLPEQEPGQQFRPDLPVPGLPNPVSNCLDLRSPKLTHVNA